MSGLTNPSPATNLKFDASNNVLANINAQAINPNINNPYLPTLLSLQTGLSITATVANTFYNIGTAISIARAGILKISILGHVNAGAGYIILQLTRGGVTYTHGSISSSLFSWGNSGPETGIFNTTVVPLFASGLITTAGTFSNKYTCEINVNNGDSIQFKAANNTAADITYIDDLIVMLQ